MKVILSRKAIVLTIIIILLIPAIVFVWLRMNADSSSFRFNGINLDLSGFVKARYQYSDDEDKESLTLIDTEFKNNQETHIPNISISLYQSDDEVSLAQWTTAHIIQDTPLYKEHYYKEVGSIGMGYKDFQYDSDEALQYVSVEIHATSSVEYIKVISRLDDLSNIYVIRKHLSGQSTSETEKRASEVEEYILKKLLESFN